jgi:hypothetical protein
MKIIRLRTQARCCLTLVGLFLSLAEVHAQAPRVSITLDASTSFQTVDGFGVNINPMLWRDGNLKPALDLLVDDLGCTLFRLDPTGLAKWLDPAKRQADGHYPAEYLKEVYTSAVFRDAWATFRALNAKGIKPFLNASGHIPPGLGKKNNPKHLADFEGYAEMVVTMTKWAREQEHLQFTMLAPFNETDLGFPEGPKIEQEDVIPAIEAILKALDAQGLSDVRLILMDDAGPHRDRIEPILKRDSWTNRVAAFGFHSYGDGDEGDSSGWQGGTSAYGKLREAIQRTRYAKCPVWMTEYGDLDQTGFIENEMGWRSTRRLLKFLREGLSAGLIWDAFDNLHLHDDAWSTYGVLATDTNSWKYTPKPRFYAAKQVFRFVRPGFVRVATEPARPDTKSDPYADWRNPARHLLVCSFVSPDRKDFTIVGMSRLEVPCTLSVRFTGLNDEALTKPVGFYHTTATDACRPGAPVSIKDRALASEVSPRSIFTLSTLR